MATNLEFIKSASGSSVSSLSVTDCFSDEYDLYKISISKLDQSAQNYLTARFIDSGGSVISNAEYDRASLIMEANVTFTENRATGQTSFNSSISFQGTGADDGVGITMYVFNPNDSSSFTFIKSQSSSYYNHGIGTKMIGVHKVAEQITGMNFFVMGTSSTLDNIIVNVYGVR